MLQLYYNAAHPIEILESFMIKSSICCNRDRGVSMSSRMIESHGPFTFVFKPGRDWYGLFTEVQYGNFSYMRFARENNEKSLEEHQAYDFTHKIEDFRDEHEWWAPGPIRFQLEDIQKVVFRGNSAGAKLRPIISKRSYKKLREVNPVFDVNIHL